MKKILLIACISVCLAACTHNTPQFDKKKTEAEVAAMFTRYFADIKNKGLMAETNYLDTSADFFWVPPGYSGHLNYAEVITAIEQNSQTFKTIDNKWSSVHIRPLGNETAAYTGIIISVSTDTADITRTVSLQETGVVIKRADGWKLLCGQTEVLPQINTGN